MSDVKDASVEQEKRVAKRLSGKVVAGSGNGKFNGGDVETECFLIECKTSVKPTVGMTVKKEWLEKIEQQRFEQGKDACALAISFGDGEDHYIINGGLMSYLKDFLEFEIEQGKGE